MAEYKWDKIGDALKKALPEITVIAAKDNSSAVVFLHSTSAAILMYLPRTEETREALGISFRASCPPIPCGMISIICSMFLPIEYDEYFEVDKTGKKLYGNEALRFAWSTSSSFVNSSDEHFFMNKQILQPN
jgi:hypothetical protein